MKRQIQASFAVLGITVMMTASVAAQGRGREKSLSPNVRSQLWPEQQLTPSQQEYKDNVVAMRDSVIRVKATIEQVDRARRRRNAPTVMLAASRRLIDDCQRVDRNAERLMPWAQGLSTDDPEFGEGALRTFREALADLKLQMASCGARLTQLTSHRDSLVRDEVYEVLQRSRKAISEYETATLSLTKTLKITILPTEKS